ncbi:uncharacterized protein B0I36DRAFT_392583 [Microdochium trichocladiopsis]|uniref:C2H2-type domain-containing protein n=1 Tax=Microdochium trichocladiopsis TaxID=1682393 RepID=A0A9P8YJF6_9PEZI|nr:uncharacterized protein B0I36DRAFT_392583 [Microdochium trichocladiopsis]KAH7041524.1 hypothetical protein B0I36DRAFT_392583 [Microdochium trichocladiopsis]
MPPNCHFECGTCLKEFPAGWHARENHCRSTDDYYWECTECNDAFDTEQQVVQHEADEHLYCRPCERYFQSDNSIRMHLNSRVHRGANIDCPFCDRSYTAATGVAHHLEAGSCPRAPNLNRDEIFRMLSRVDQQGAMTKKLLSWHGSTTYEATALSWNGRAYECYLCHRSFTTLHGLNQHLGSPIHQQALYHCPKRDCRQDFKSIAGFINHLESETCGYMRFGDVQKRAQDMLRNGRLLAY